MNRPSGGEERRGFDAEGASVGERGGEGGEEKGGDDEQNIVFGPYDDAAGKSWKRYLRCAPGDDRPHRDERSGLEKYEAKEGEFSRAHQPKQRNLFLLRSHHLQHNKCEDYRGDNGQYRSKETDLLAGFFDGPLKHPRLLFRMTRDANRGAFPERRFDARKVA